MSSVFAPLSDKEERLAINWQPTKLSDTPQALHRLAHVVTALEEHFLSDQFDHSISEESVTFRHKIVPQILVRVWVNHGSLLSQRLLDPKLTRYLPPLLIVVGIDLTSYSPIQRYTTRQFLRSRFVYHDPEGGTLPVLPGHERKVSTMGDYLHWLELVFLPDAPCEMPVDDRRVSEIESAIKGGAPTW